MNSLQKEYAKIMGVKKTMFVIFAIFIFLIAIRFFGGTLSLEIGLVTSLIIFIYGFFINALLNFIEVKYVNFKKSMADTSANIQTFYNLALVSKQDKFKKKAQIVLIDFLNSLKNLSPIDYNMHQEYVNKLYAVMESFKAKSAKEKVIFEKLFFCLFHLSQSRERAELFGHKYLLGETKTIFLSLTFITIFSVIIVVIHDFFLTIFGFFLILVLIFISYLIFDLDNNNYGRFNVRLKNVDELLDFIINK